MILNLRSLLCGVAVVSLGCKQPAAPPAAPAPTAPAPAAADAQAPAASAGTPLDPTLDAVLIGGQHDTLTAAGQGLEAALKLAVDLPLPFPRVERHADEFRVVLARGKAAALTALQAALQAAGYAATLTPAGQAGGDDVVRLGIVCTDGSPALLYQSPLSKDAAPRELARLQTGQIVVPKEEDEGAGESDEGAHDGRESSPEVESGYLTVLQPRAGLLPSPTVLLPADCTPRDEDNDDGNGRLLQGGRLCLTTRFSGKKGQIPHADLLAVTPNYRRCVRFPDAGTFDGFDHDSVRTQFAVEAQLRNTAPEAPPGPAGSPKATARPAPANGLAVYAVSPRGELTLRGQLPGLQRPAYLGEHLVAIAEPQPAGGPAAAALPPGIVVLAGAGKPGALPGAALPAPRRIFSFAPGAYLPLVPKGPTYRPAAPTLHDGRVHASFHQGCRPDGDKRVRAAAKGSFIQCLMEVEVEVGLDGSRPQQHCRLDNVHNNLEEPLPTPCPG